MRHERKDDFDGVGVDVDVDVEVGTRGVRPGNQRVRKISSPYPNRPSSDPSQSSVGKTQLYSVGIFLHCCENVRIVGNVKEIYSFIIRN